MPKVRNHPSPERRPGGPRRVRAPRRGSPRWRWAAAPAALALALCSAAGLASYASHDARAATPLIYYVSSTGNDAAAGTSPSTAWQTLNRATSAVLAPGTQLLLEGGDQFTGPLGLTSEDAGDARNPVKVGSYGQGQATIVAPSGSAVVVFNTAGVNFSNLVLAGQASPPEGAGIDLYNGLPGTLRLNHVVITHVEVSGFADGILVGGQGAYGFRHVRVAHSSVHDNLANGLRTYGPVFDAANPAYANTHITVSHVTAFRNFGDPADTQHNSGSGIVFGSVRRGVVAWSSAYDNGGQGGALHNGPVGIWAYDSSYVVIKHNLAYKTHSGGHADGGGFDLDQNTSHSTMEYNLSYNNDGAGYLVYTHLTNRVDRGNVVRFNISSGDTRNNPGYAGIQVVGRVIGARVYQNTVVMARRTTTSPAMPLVLGKGLVRTTIRNNIFLTRQPGPIVYSRRTLSTSAVLLQGNDYFSTTGKWTVLWNTTRYHSLRALRAGTGQELLAGNGTGFAVGPKFTGPVLGLTVTQPGGGGSGFVLLGGSPLLHKGLDLFRLFGIWPGPIDYSGKSVTSSKLNVGAQ